MIFNLIMPDHFLRSTLARPCIIFVFAVLLWFQNQFIPLFLCKIEYLFVNETLKDIILA